MFAVVQISGKQYYVEPKQVIDVDKLPDAEGSELKIAEVLLKSDGDVVSVGHPFVQGALVTAKVVKQFRGEKINVRRYKSKVRYRKSTGFRPSLTQLEIQHIA